jgi:hypothetical protein
LALRDTIIMRVPMRGLAALVVRPSASLFLSRLISPEMLK